MSSIHSRFCHQKLLICYSANNKKIKVRGKFENFSCYLAIEQQLQSWFEFCYLHSLHHIKYSKKISKEKPKNWIFLLCCLRKSNKQTSIDSSNFNPTKALAQAINVDSNIHFTFKQFFFYWKSIEKKTSWSKEKKERWKTNNWNFHISFLQLSNFNSYIR